MAGSSHPPRVPSVGGDPRDQSDVDEPQGKTWFRDLDEAVIEADRCIQCGTCIAACPSDSIGVDDREARPTLVRMCTGCSRCWDFCPRSGMRYERLLRLEADQHDASTSAYASRATTEALTRDGQDGGTVTALLGTLLDAGAIDAALVATESEESPLTGEAFLATSREELLAGTGSIYDQPMQLGHLADLIDDAGLEDPDVAVVGTPCVIEGAAALERYEWDDEASPIALTIALMCTRNFDGVRLRALLASADVDPAAVERIDVTEGVLRAMDGDGEVLEASPVSAFDAAALEGCAECADFLGRAADISAGSVGSEDGYTTVLVRTDRGRQAWEAAADSLESHQLEDTADLERLAERNSHGARETLPREYDPDGALSITYEAHREAYDGTDREPQPLNPARVYQYEEWC